MIIQQIRNSTLRIAYAGRQILTDPLLAEKHSMKSFANISPNPLLDLPCPPEEVVAGIEMVLVSHLHPDHFDEQAEKLLPKDIQVFCQPGDETRLAEKGFQSVTAVESSIGWRGITLTLTPGQHGTGKWAERLGKVSGFVFQADNEPTVYWAGDTIWCDAVRKVIADTQPAVIITHSSGAKIADSDPIVMDARQTIEVCREAPQAIVVATHMEALDHGTISREDLRSLADKEGIPPNRLLIPSDGETLSF